MRTPTRKVEIAKFLEEAGWLRTLARRLVSAEEVDELVQDTWVQFAHHSTSPRGWLAKVANNARRMKTRAAVRRRLREAKTLAVPEVPLLYFDSSEAELHLGEIDP